MHGKGQQKILSEKSLSPRPDHAIFFRFVRKQCCNNYAHMSRGKKHSCWLGRPRTHGLCVIPDVLTKDGFVKALLPWTRAFRV